MAAEASMFFFEKKNQKTSDYQAPVLDWHPCQCAKVFCFFFSKKKSLS
jgi:hypothetical protein